MLGLPVMGADPPACADLRAYSFPFEQGSREQQLR